MSIDRVPVPIEIRLAKTAAIACAMQRYRLSAREQQVAWQYLAGVPHLTIARTLCIQVATVKRHVTNIAVKLGIAPITCGCGRIQFYRALLGAPEHVAIEEAA